MSNDNEVVQVEVVKKETDATETVVVVPKKDLIDLSKEAKVGFSYTLAKGVRRIKVELRYHQTEDLYILCDGFYQTVEAAKVTPWIVSLLSNSQTAAIKEFEWYIRQEYTESGKGFSVVKQRRPKDYAKVFTKKA